MSLTSRVVAVKGLRPGDAVGYGSRFTKSTPATIAVVPAGYADGLDRRLSNGKGAFLVTGRLVPIIGNICMDMTMIDVTNVKKIKIDDEVVLLGRQKQEEISAETIAGKINTINYEVTTRINPLIKRFTL